MLRLSTSFWYAPGMDSVRPYHHGNLKPALLKAAVGLIAEVGPAAFTLREVARRAGISHNAPYRHFREKDELLAAVAAEGFERLADALSKPEKSARTRGPNPALRRFLASGKAYVQFALRSPEHLQVMFDWPLVPDRYPELSAAAQRAFSILVGLVESAQSEGSLPGGDPIASACIAWSLVHGVAKLAVGRKLPFRSEQQILRFATQAIQALYEGMGTKRDGS